MSDLVIKKTFEETMNQFLKNLVYFKYHSSFKLKKFEETDSQVTYKASLSTISYNITFDLLNTINDSYPIDYVYSLGYDVVLRFKPVRKVDYDA